MIILDLQQLKAEKTEYPIQEIQCIIDQYIRCIKAKNRDEIKVVFNFYYKHLTSSLVSFLV